MIRSASQGPHRRSTIRDVAARAGVTPSVVSFVTNGRKWVAPRTRERVERAIADLDYRPHRLARALRTQRSGVVAIVVPQLGSAFHGLLAEAAEEVLLSHRLLALVTSIGRPRGQERDPALTETYRRTLADAHLDGLIVEPGRVAAPWLREFVRSIPSVVIESVAAGLAESAGPAPVDRLVVDHAAGTVEAVRHLLALGHRQITLIGPETPHLHGAAQVGAFHANMEAAGVPSECARSVTGAGWEDDGAELARAALAQSPRPTALIAGTNLQTIGVLRALRDAGLRVPDDISLVGFGPGPYTVPIPDLTVVEHPTAEVGRQAAELLVSRLSGSESGPTRTVTLPTRLRVGGSSAPPR